MFKKLLSLGLVLMTLLGLMIPMMSSASAEEPAVISTMVVKCSNGGKLNVRETPSTDSKILARIANKKKVEVLDVAAPAGWAYVHEVGKNTTGYVMTKFLAQSKSAKYQVTEPENDFIALSAPYTVTAKALNAKTKNSVGLRVSPNKSASMMRRLKAGDKLQVIAVGNVWSKVMDPLTGKTGYVANDYIR